MSTYALPFRDSAASHDLYCLVGDAPLECIGDSAWEVLLLEGVGQVPVHPLTKGPYRVTGEVREVSGTVRVTWITLLTNYSSVCDGCRFNIGSMHVCWFTHGSRH